jgi:Tol biopolymer transport system component
MNLRPQYSPDGEKVSFISLRSGFAEVWVSDANGQQAAAITARSDPSTGDPYWSPDGKFLVFIGALEGHYQVFRVSAAGGPAMQLTHDSSMHVQPSWSRDGKWIYFASNLAGSFQIYKIPSNGGEPVQVTQHAGFASLESPDGTFLYFTESDTSLVRLWKRNLVSGTEEPLALSVWKRNFVPIQGGLYFEAALGPQQIPGVWFVRLENMKPRLIHRFEGVAPPGFLSVSPDGKYLLFTRYKVDSHVMIVHGFL